LLWPKNEQAEAALTILKQYDPAQGMRSETCFLSVSKRTVPDEAACLHVVSDRPNVLIFGDSHAAQLWYGFFHRYGDVNFLQATGGNCTAVNGFNNTNCSLLNASIISDFLPKHHLDAIILAGRWSGRDMDRLHQLLERIRPYAEKLFLIGPFPEYSLPFGEVAARAIYAHQPGLVNGYLNSQISALDETMRVEFANSGVSYLSAYKIMCSPDCIQTDAQGNLTMFDNDHLTDAGSLMFAYRLPEDLFDYIARR
jgi:hypothetical protein